jgi:tetratricopeptide (TPR) repeat protein
MNKLFKLEYFILVLFFLSCSTNENPKTQTLKTINKADLDSLIKNGNIAFNSGDFTKAIDLFTKTLTLGEWKKDSSLFYETKLNLACAYNRFQSNNIALKIAQEALEGFKRNRDTRHIGTTYSTLSAFYGELFEFEKAKLMALEGMKYLKNQNDSLYICQAYNQFAFIFTDQEDFKNGLLYFDTALIYLTNNNFKEHASSIYVNMSDCYVSLSKLDIGITYLEKALELSSSANQIFLKNLIYSKLSYIYELKKMYKESLYYLNESVLIKEQIFSKEKSEALASIEIKYKSKEKEDEIKNLIKEQKLIKTRRNLLIITLTISLFLLLSIIYIIISKLRKAKELLIEKDNELINYFNLLRQKNIELNILLDIRKNSEKNISEKDILNIDNQIVEYDDLELFNSRIITNEDWEFFKKRFELIHPGLILKIRNSYPDITAAEERLFLLIKIKIKTQEIAIMIGISDDSVKKTRQRLRKRLNIGNTENLEKFIEKFN